MYAFCFSSRRRHTRCYRDWSSDVCSSDLLYADLAAATRSVVKVPVILAGRVSTPEQAERVLASGVCDMVGMTRAMIADPEMPKKAMEGRLDDIRTCVGASEGCIGRLRQGKAITCVQNPLIGREAELGGITPAARAKRE